MAPSMRLPNANLAASLPQVGREFLNIKDGTRQVREDIDKRERDKKEKVLSMILKDPKNADMYSQTYGVPISQELRAVLQQPAVAQRMGEAYDIAQSLKIENPAARTAFTKRYIENGGNLADAAASIEGMDTRRPMSIYEEQSLATRRDIANSRVTNRPRAIPVGFAGSVSKYIDQMRGVRWADKEQTALLKGSPQPLDPMAAAQIAELVAVETQKTGNPVSAIQKVWNDIGGEAGLQDGNDSPFAYGSMRPSGVVSREPGAVKYKTIKNIPQSSLIPREEPMSPSTGNAVLDVYEQGYDRDVESPDPMLAPVDEQIRGEALSDDPQIDISQYENVIVPEKAQADSYGLPTQTPPFVAPSGPSPVIDRPAQPKSNPMMDYGYAKTGVMPPENNLSINTSPVKVNSPDEARALPKGTKFITPDGRVKIVR